MNWKSVGISTRNTAKLLPSSREWGVLGRLNFQVNMDLLFGESAGLNYHPSVVSAWTLGKLLYLSWPQFPFLGNEGVEFDLYGSSRSKSL